MVLWKRVVHVSRKDYARAVNQHVQLWLEVLHVDSLLAWVDGGFSVFKLEQFVPDSLDEVLDNTREYFLGCLPCTACRRRCS